MRFVNCLLLGFLPRRGPPYSENESNMQGRVDLKGEMSKPWGHWVPFLVDIQPHPCSCSYSELAVSSSSFPSKFNLAIFQLKPKKP